MSSPVFFVAYQYLKHILWLGIAHGTFCMESNKPNTELSIRYNRWLMPKKSLNMMKKMMVPNNFDNYVINCATPFTIINRSRISFCKPGLIRRRAAPAKCLYFWVFWEKIVWSWGICSATSHYLSANFKTKHLIMKIWCQFNPLNTVPQQ